MGTDEPVTFRDVILQPDMIRIFLASLFILGQVLVSFSLVPLYIVERGGDTFAVGMQTTVFAAASVVLRFVFGPMADMRGRRFVLALGAFVFATANLAIYYAPSLLWMTVARVYQAVGMASYLASASSLVADLAPVQFRGSAIGAYRMMMPLASLIGPFLGNSVINRYGFRTFFFAMAGAAFFSFFVVLSLRSGRRPIAGSVVRISRRDVFSMFRIPDLRAAYLGILLIAIGGGIVNTFITAYGAPFFDNPAVYFIVYAFVGAGGAFVLGRISDRTGRLALVVPVIGAMALGLITLRFLAEAPQVVYLLSAAGTGLGFNSGLSVLISWVVDSIPLHLRATAQSLQESWIDGGFAVGIFLFGTFSVTFGEPRLFLWTGIFVATGIVGVLAMADRSRGTTHTGVDT
ncbi:MAG: MFS transporter [Spirochaeta sp.]|jgi:MFS family permease|nr:MFS transporter [Spirochaeta sp.]